MTMKSKTQELVMTGIMAGVIMVMTFIVRIPIPATQGYIHLGDFGVFLVAILLGWKKGAMAAGVGSALADVIGGYVIYAPVTLVVKGLMALIVGLMIAEINKRGIVGKKAKFLQIISMIVGGTFMCFGYYMAESIMYGNFITPLASVGMNVLQFSVGIILALAVMKALPKKYIEIFQV